MFVMLVFLLMVFWPSTPAAAALESFVAVNNGTYYQYAYQELLDSYALKMAGNPNGLYEDYSAKTPYALLDSQKGYIDYLDVLDQYAGALIAGDDFLIEEYLQSGGAKKAKMPAEVKLVTAKDGKIAETPKRIEDGAILTQTNLLGPAEISLERAREWAAGREAHQRLIDIASAYWTYGKKSGLRPEVLFAQAALETDFGHFTGRLGPEHNNWAGIRAAASNSDNLPDYESFISPDEGVRAHFNHLSAYTGLDPLGTPHPRYHVVKDQPWAGSIRYLEELVGKWTPEPEYPVYVIGLANQMLEGTAPTSNPGIRPDNPQTNPAGERDLGGANHGSAEVVVDVAVLNLRGGPGTGYSVIGQLSRGTVLTVTENGGTWLGVLTPPGKAGWVHSDYVTTIRSGYNPFRESIIVIDPGHGGSDPGAVGFTGLKEKDVTMAVAGHLTVLLEEAGAKVVLTRSGDQSVNNRERVKLANLAGADLYLSIHANSYNSVESNGTETYFSPGKEQADADRHLARQVQREVVKALGLRDRGVKSANFYVLANTDMPAALVELGFLSNQKEEDLLRRPETHALAAQALFRGIEAYLQTWEAR